jgi:hypothetical protein
MTRYQAVNGCDGQPRCQEVKRNVGNPQGSPLKPGFFSLRVLANAQHHGENTQPGKNLNKRVDPESKQGQCLILKSEID